MIDRNMQTAMNSAISTLESSRLQRNQDHIFHKGAYFPPTLTMLKVSARPSPGQCWSHFTHLSALLSSLVRLLFRI